MQPANKDAREKYEITQKEHRLQLLSQSIGYEDQKIQVNAEEIFVEASYCGPKLETVDDITP
jgi:hypothetical protein